MKLENILNDVSIECDPPYHSRNFCVSPEHSEAQYEVDVSLSSFRYPYLFIFKKQFGKKKSLSTL